MNREAQALGRKGGKARMASMSAKERSALGRMASNARWDAVREERRRQKRRDKPTRRGAGEKHEHVSGFLALFNTERRAAKRRADRERRNS
jgi:hypothetical protein